jgi:hypothetical protein
MVTTVPPDEALEAVTEHDSGTPLADPLATSQLMSEVWESAQVVVAPDVVVTVFKL